MIYVVMVVSCIHSLISTNGSNCFVGDIHYGDVVPPKDPTCTFFTDHFASYTVPTNTCTFTNKVVNTAGTTLTPGTMHYNYNTMPVQEMSDLTFVFTE